MKPELLVALCSLTLTLACTTTRHALCDSVIVSRAARGGAAPELDESSALSCEYICGSPDPKSGDFSRPYSSWALYAYNDDSVVTERPRGAYCMEQYLELRDRGDIDVTVIEIDHLCEKRLYQPACTWMAEHQAEVEPRREKILEARRSLAYRKEIAEMKSTST